MYILDNFERKKIFSYIFGLSLFITLKKSYNIFPKNYNFLEKYIGLCYTTSRLIYGENHET